MKTSTRSPQRSARAVNYNVGFSWQYLFAVIAFGMVLAAGFFFAARQHFNSMELGINNSKLRSELEDLRTENRRLTLAKEVALSPRSVKKAAHDAGLVESDVDASAMLASITAVKAPSTASTAITAKATETASAPKVQKTAFQRAVMTVASMAAKKPAGADRERIVTVAQLR